MKTTHALPLFFLFAGVLWICTVPSYSCTLHDIWEHLFVEKQYNKDIRPVKDAETITTVNLSLALIAIIDFSEVKQTISLAMKITLSWYDEYLTWNPPDYNDLDHFHVPQTDVWKPNVYLENSVTKQEEFGTSSLHVVVNYDGQVKWRTVEVFETTCTTDVKHFPFDEQTCFLTFEAHGYTEADLKVKSPGHFEIHSYGGTAGWSIMSTGLASNEDEDEIHVVAYLSLARNPFYIVLNVMLPIALLSLLNNCVFLLPVESGERASFVVTVFLSLAVFLTVVSEKLPENSDTISLLNIYVFFNTLASVIIAVVTLIQIRLYHKKLSVKIPCCLANLTLSCSTVKLRYPYVTSNRAKCHLGENNADHDKTGTISKLDNILVLTWPDVVKALDHIFLLVFLLANVTMTVAFLSLTQNRDCFDARLDSAHHF